MRVLVVDDDDSVRTVVRVAFENAEVVEAHDGVEALDMLSMSQFDAVILDVMMPTLNGFKVLSHIRQTQRTADVPVVMLTAKVSETDHLRGFQSGADAYLCKPFDIDELVSTVEEIVERSPAERKRMRESELGKAELLRQIERRFAL